MKELLIPNRKKNGQPYTIEKTFFYHIPGVALTDLPFMTAHTKGEARARLKQKFNLKQLPLGTHLMETENEIRT